MNQNPAPSAFTVKLPVFDGSIDLLLFVVRQRQIDFSELQLARIASDFLEYARSIEDIDLDFAGEVIYIAAVLLRMKVKSLLPKDEEEEDLVELDLAERDEELEEIYREIVAAARKLAEGESLQSKHFPRGKAAEHGMIDETEELLRDVSLIQLAEAFRDLTRELEKPSTKQLTLFKVTVRQQASLILRVLRERGKIRFRDLIAPFKERIEAVVTFLAMLNLIQQGKIRVSQRGLFGPIWIHKGS
ncbi:segregation and condensation protein A [Calditrichota bacterium]